jgi:4-amino-4-deoxy-L-arabinose transferase-like glycosyltransferase
MVWSWALGTLALHLAVNAFGGYGYHRDELYYIACSEHLAWGYVDQPPFSVAVLWVSRQLFGDSLFALRLLPALSGAAVVGLAGRLAAELGGGRFAQTLACCCVLASPLVVGMNGVFSMNSFDILCWTAAAFLLVRLAKSGESKYWMALGAVLGVGLLNKLSVLWLGAGIIVGILVTAHRSWFLRKEPWIAAAIILAVFSPHLLWQAANGYPTLEFIRNASSGKYAALSPIDLFLQQTLFMNPATLPIWLGGAIYFLVSKGARTFRLLPLIYVTVFAILAINVNSKAEYLGPLIPMLCAMGGVTAEHFIVRRGWAGMRPAIVAIVLLAGSALAPLVLAVLPVDAYVRYAAALGVGATTSEGHAMGVLPQHYADRFGWEEMTTAVANAYHSLQPADREKCAIYCSNYGEAGAIDFFGPRHDLPRAISGHNNYWLWGPRGTTGEVVLRLGGSRDDLLQYYGEVTQVGYHDHPYSMRYESDMPLWLCRNRRSSLSAAWAEFKTFN